jgi:hypothetical protein
MKKLIVIFAAAMLTFSCKNTADQAGVVEDNKQAVIDSMNIEMAKKEAALARQKSIDSMQTIAAAKRERVVVHHNVAAASPAAPAPAAKRKGWSGAAKGAVIGAGVGAIGGAVIDKKKPGQGAVIGGLAGAGLGAGTGAILDAEKKKKAAQQGQ